MNDIRAWKAIRVLSDRTVTGPQDSTTVRTRPKSASTAPGFPAKCLASGWLEPQK
ncbi:MAG TPA: hypothetical protein VMH79_10895 [Thermoanaerobaculia bacterium]|nr:hypothetical protein [Thermoanaerobaculia bacterium]